ncbi:hypothetical protein MMC20_007529 [Loxospora ochrophaea]|nr:hypothetical protein [Loxospora ochrophaea]
MPLLQKAVKGVASGIGLASEAITAHKESKGRSRDPSRDLSQPRELALSPSPSGKSQEASDRDSSQPRKLPLSSSLSGKSQELSNRDPSPPPSYSEVEETGDDLPEYDEEDWELDDAATVITDSRAESSDQEPPKDTGELLRAFIARNPAPARLPQGQLPCPVILPQRRPKDKSRGFVRAYAPVLNDCGIDQATFMDFLNTFDKASKASPAIQVVNVAAMIVGFVPSAAAQITSTVVNIACVVGIKVQEAARTHSFLQDMNEKFFQPHGLYCLIMTYKPEQSETHELVNINNAIAKSLNPSDSRTRRQLDKLKVSSGKTYGEMQMPEAAPLVFPTLDNASDAQKKNAFKKSSNFVGDYLDRRAQATYNAKNPNSSLSVAPEPKFTSRYSDPNHPASNGNLISLVTGGYVNPEIRRGDRRRGGGGPIGLIAGVVGEALKGKDESRGMERRGYDESQFEGRGFGNREYSSRRERRRRRSMEGRGYAEQEYQGRDYEGRGYEGRGYGSQLDTTRRRGNRRQNDEPRGLRRFLAQNVMYLMIVNMPSQEEMDAALRLMNNRS